MASHFADISTYLELQHSIMFDELNHSQYGDLCASFNDRSAYWNNYAVPKPLTKNELTICEQQMLKKDRKPSFYFESTPLFDDFTQLLIQKGYTKTTKDSYLYFDAPTIDNSKFESIQKVETQDDLTLYLQTFNQCYKKDDPKNPYGELGEYLEAARKVWEKHHETNRLEYFIVHEDDIPVAVSALTNNNGFGYISNVGSLRSVRGKGYGKAATLYCVKVSRDRGNKECFLITEEGTNPHEFYQAMGFHKKFSALLMTK